jgi:mannitol/fructose-specific phosphotransferase system IIA component (Ntr-type)
MSTIADSLLIKDIHSQLKANDHRDALEELLSPLRSDSRVHDWENLRSALLADSPNDYFAESPSILFLHHSRTESVSSLVLTLGRSKEGIALPGQEHRIHLVIAAAIPEALNNEYLRILGAISRICREPSTLSELLEAKGQGEILTVLEKGCLQ